MTPAMLDRVRALPGDLGAEPAGAGGVRAAPATAADLAALVLLANQEGWRFVVRGHGGWISTPSPDAAATTPVPLLEITARRLAGPPLVAPADLVVTVEAGLTLAALHEALAARGVWLPIDPPGGGSRSLGSAVATGMAGPLRHRYGGWRDLVLGCTLVTGDGRIVTAGGKVVKNVAGYDLTRLQVGGFGAFGLVTAFHLRLQARARSDRTVLVDGPRDTLTRLARELLAGATDAAAIEILSPKAARRDSWVLAVRFLGPPAAVEAGAGRLAAARRDGMVLDDDASQRFWANAARAMGSAPGSLRFGVLPDGLDELLDRLEQLGGLELVSATPGAASLRWGGAVDASQVIALRAALAPAEIPVTLERAPWTVLRHARHYGAYREGVGAIVTGLRRAFDPAGMILTPLDGDA